MPCCRAFLALPGLLTLAAFCPFACVQEGPSLSLLLAVICYSKRDRYLFFSQLLFITTMSTSDSNFNMASLLTEALLLNNEGVAFLLAGKSQEAIHFLKKGLSLLDQSLSHTPIRNPSHSSSICSSLDDLCVISAAPFLQGLEQVGSGHYELFDSAMALLPQEDRFFSQETMTFFTGASLLNLGLAFHQLGRRAAYSPSKNDQARSVAFFRKADCLYRAVSQMMQVSIQQQQSSSAVFRFLAIAAQNNRLGLALQQTNTVASTEPAQHLKDTLRDMIASVSPERLLSERGVEFLNEFLLNCTVLDMTCMFTTMSAPCA